MELTDGQLNARRDRLTGFLDAWGDLIVRDLGRDTNARLLEFVLSCPGVDLPTEVEVRYREYFRRASRGGWTVAQYHYEHLDAVRSKRLAYHLHDIGSRALVPHAHCEDSGELPSQPSTESRHHQLRVVELDLREAHEEFMALWASDRAPDCTSFRPLEIKREP